MCKRTQRCPAGRRLWAGFPLGPCGACGAGGANRAGGTWAAGGSGGACRAGRACNACIAWEAGRPCGSRGALGAWNSCWPGAAGGTLGASRARGPWLPWGAGWPGGPPLPRWPGWAGRPLLPGGAGRSLRAGTATWPTVIIDVVAHTRAPFPSSIWRGGGRVTKREGNASPSLQAGWLIRCSPPRCPDALGGEIGVDEAVQVAVHHGVDVAGLIAGAVVLDQGVGHEHVGADLAAPGDLLLLALDVRDLLQVLPLLDLHQLGRAASSWPLSRFWNWLRSIWQDTTMPVGMWVRRTAEEVLLTCWPPAPLER